MKHNQWWKNAVIYETYVDKFAGNFRNFEKKLEYLKDLGIDCIHILPFFPSPGADEGYDVTNYTDVRKELGTLENARSFIAEASRRNIRIIIDLVLNHTSIQHPWFKEALSSPKSPKYNYYLWSSTGSEFPEAYNPFSHFKPKNWIHNPGYQQYYYSSFLPEQADLNWDNPKVEKEILKVIDFWAGMGISGFRLDAVSFLIKREGTSCHHLPETHAVLKRLRKHIEKINPEIIFLAEVHASLEITSSYFGKDDECHMAYHFPFMQQVFLSLARKDPSVVQNIITASANIPNSCQWATFLTCHDEITFTIMDAPERAEVLSFLDPEDKWAFKPGKSVATRLASALKGDRDKIIETFRLLLKSPGSPVIYYGSEIGMLNAKLSPPPRDTRLYLRNPFDWALAESEIKNPNSIFNSVKNLIHERKNII
ncbi:MAG: hypothetical protein A3J46_01290 [Candidatus Yanofskybacteria bacterium RIFCSPHIGHO2_02_FULL_41_11]|uniref:Glycosyl hydrolase family 13 catalytic domain-containing protein n=1 Tax=Candidatus Yanofskybacteria bacterium RIFCSPHIGHO2_02_FULL_41_11 TaxID=1802675 RepID=A0A1F8FA27_9BACT|nr:MAG: hypothetical protein A3J46_01290 [Candidatus Yanofskybacteria bacterium RIFCSPHIGHO2_02_FULL_41_11]